MIIYIKVSLVKTYKLTEKGKLKKSNNVTMEIN